MSQALSFIVVVFVEVRCYRVEVVLVAFGCVEMVVEVAGGGSSGGGGGGGDGGGGGG